MRSIKQALCIPTCVTLLSGISGWAATPGPRLFATPKAAVDALIAAASHNDSKALLSLFGPEGRDIVESGDRAEDRKGRTTFATLAKQHSELTADPMNPDRETLSIGSQDWPFPIPLQRTNGQWQFDAADGRTEILARRIGANELTAITVCRGYAEAQGDYARTHLNKGVPEYARSIADVLKYEQPYHGYYFRVLTAQGPNAHGGAMDYIVNNAMIAGFGLVAWPAKYGVSGVQTFMINDDGIVYEKDFGPETEKLAGSMTTFNPDSSWRVSPADDDQ